MPYAGKHLVEVTAALEAHLPTANIQSACTEGAWVKVCFTLSRQRRSGTDVYSEPAQTMKRRCYETMSPFLKSYRYPVGWVYG